MPTYFTANLAISLPFVDPDPDLYPGLGSAWGAYSEYAVVHDAAAYEEGTAPECAYGQTILPEDVDPVDGAMIVTLREVLSSIKRFGIKAGNSVAVFGCGPVGLTFIRFMSLLGVHPLIAFDVKDEKIGEALVGSEKYQYVLPFEFISLFLLACIIGGLVVSRNQKEDK